VSGPVPQLAVSSVALVTGASSGIGQATVLAFLEHGFTTYAAARRVDAMRGLESRGAQLMRLDLAEPHTIERCVREIEERSGRLDVLVNNAGYGLYGAVEDVPLAAARDEMEVNLFGMGHLTQLVLPLMRHQRSGRIINVSSVGGRVWSLLGAWYQASKFAMEGFSDCLRNEVRSFGIIVVVVQPGGVRTAWSRQAAESARRASGQSAYAPLVERVERVLGMEWAFAEPEAVAKAICRAATVRRPKARYVVPLTARGILLLRWLLPDRVFDWTWRRFYRMK